VAIHRCNAVVAERALDVLAAAAVLLLLLLQVLLLS
jgi:hypothetical protein